MRHLSCTRTHTARMTGRCTSTHRTCIAHVEPTRVAEQDVSLACLALLEAASFCSYAWLVKQLVGYVSKLRAGLQDRFEFA
jgi:hypothetical protein